MRTRLIPLMIAALILCSMNLYGSVLVYEGFGNAPDTNTTLVGYSGTDAEMGLAGTWAVTGGSQNTVSRTAYEYVGVAGGYAPDTVGSRQHWWEHNNVWGLNTATRPLSGVIDMTVDGTWYMSFFSMSGRLDYAVQAGLNDGTNELMWGHAYYTAGNLTKGLTAYYGATGTGATTNANGTYITGFDNSTTYKTGLLVAKLVKSNSDTTDDLTVSIKFYDLGLLSSPTNTIDAGDPAAWTRVVSLSGVSTLFSRLELKLDGAGGNWPSIDEVRIGQTWADVTVGNVQLITPYPTGAQNVAIDTNLEWVVHNGWAVDVYMSAAYADPNPAPVLSLVDAENATGLYDPTSDLENGKWFYWRLDELEPNTVGYIVHQGMVWNFKTMPAEAIINAVSPSLSVVEAGDSSVLSVTGTGLETYQWYKIGVPDTLLTEGAKYTGVGTNTLTINDVQVGDEGYYYCVGSNSLPTSASNRETGPGRVMTRRLTSYYPFETTSIADGNTITPDVVGGYDAVLLAESGQAAPGLSDANQLDLPVVLGSDGTYGSGHGLLLDNGDHAADPNGQYAQLPAGVVDYDDMTISVWAHPKSVAVWARLVDFGNGTPDYLFITPDFGSGYDPRFVIRIDNGSEQQLQPDLNSENWIGPGGWHHVVVTLSGNTGRMYVDGVLRATNTSMSLNPVNVGAVLNYIGKSQYPADPEFDGLIDDLKIYNYALSTVEIGQEYLKYADPTGYVCNLEVTALPYDFDGNCKVDFGDLQLLAENWLNSNRIY